MFQVLDHAAVVYTGELSQTTQYIIEHYGKKLDEAIRSGIKIGYVEHSEPERVVPEFWKPCQEWLVD
jgi:hypothetical protein